MPVDLSLDLPSLVLQYSRHLCMIGGGTSASRSAKFGVAVFKAPMFD